MGRETLDGVSDSRKLRVEKRHAARLLLRLLRASQIADCHWTWETLPSPSENDTDHRLCLHLGPRTKPVCRDFSVLLLVRAANRDRYAEWVLEERLRDLVARVREAS